VGVFGRYFSRPVWPRSRRNFSCAELSILSERLFHLTNVQHSEIFSLCIRDPAQRIGTQLLQDVAAERRSGSAFAPDCQLRRITQYVCVTHALSLR
jgi:hypothetical protein